MIWLGEPHSAKSTMINSIAQYTTVLTGNRGGRGTRYLAEVPIPSMNIIIVDCGGFILNSHYNPKLLCFLKKAMAGLPFSVDTIDGSKANKGWEVVASDPSRSVRHFCLTIRLEDFVREKTPKPWFGLKYELWESQRLRDIIDVYRLITDDNNGRCVVMVTFMDHFPDISEDIVMEFMRGQVHDGMVVCVHTVRHGEHRLLTAQSWGKVRSTLEDLRNLI